MLTLRKGGLRTCGLFIFLFFFSFLLRSPKWKEPHRLRRQRGQQQAQVSLPSSVNIWSILFLAALRIACFFIFIYLSRLLFSFDTPSAENFNPFYFSFHVDQFCLAPFSHACSKYSNARIPLERTQPENRFIRSRCCVHNMIPFSFFQTGLHNRQKDNKLVHHHSTACWVLSNWNGNQKQIYVQ